MVAGIIVCAAADEKFLADPGAAASTASTWMILGGPALFLAGHAAFKLVVWRVVSWPRLAGIAVLGLLALAARAIPGPGPQHLRRGPGNRRRRQRPPALAVPSRRVTRTRRQPAGVILGPSAAPAPGTTTDAPGLRPSQASHHTRTTHSYLFRLIWV